MQGVAFYRSKKRKLSPTLRELGQTHAGYARGSRFVFSQHCKAVRDVGLSEEKIQAIPAWGVASCFSEIERAVLAYTDRLVRDGGRVPDAVFDALRGVTIACADVASFLDQPDQFKDSTCDSTRCFRAECGNPSLGICTLD